MASCPCLFSITTLPLKLHLSSIIYFVFSYTYSSVTLKLKLECFLPSFKEELFFSRFMRKNQRIHLPWFFFSALIFHNAHSKGEHKELISVNSLFGKVWRYKLSPQRSILFSCIQSTQAGSVCVSAKTSAWVICYRNKRGCYVSRKDDGSRGNSLPSTVLPTFKLCPVSSICSLQAGVPQPHQNRV